MLQKFSPFLIALLIGLLIGVEREQRKTTNPQSMGVRSFLLLAMIGAIAGAINQAFVALGLVIFAGAVVLIGYLRASALVGQKREGIGLTTEIAAMATFALGYLSNTEPLLSLALGMITTLFLYHKTSLHEFISQHLNPQEIEAFAVLLLIAVGVIPLIPNHAIDPWNIFNPYRLALIIALIAGIQFIGYLAERIFGERIGLPFGGFLAGLVSSTAVFITYPKLAEDSLEKPYSIASAAVFSIVATLCQLGILLSVVSWKVLLAISIPLSSMIIVSLAIALFLSYKSSPSPVAKQGSNNPLYLWRAIKLGLLLTGLIFIFDISERIFGSASTQIVSFLGGLFELHGVVIASANMFENKILGLQFAAETALIAIIASMVSKIAITAFLAKRMYRWLMLSISVFLCSLSIFFWLAVIYFPTLVMPFL